MSINLNKYLIFFITIAVMFITNLMSIDLIIDADYVQSKWIIILVFTITLLFFLYKDITFTASKEKWFFLFIWECFILFVFISKYINDDFNILQFVLYSFFIPLVFFSSAINKYKGIIMVSFIISVLPLIIPLIFLYTIHNTIGVYLSLGGILLIILFRNRGTKSIYIYIIIIFFSLLIILSSSRIALSAFLFGSGVQLIIMLIKNNTSFLQVNIKSIILLTTMFITYLSEDKIRDYLFNKFGGTKFDVTSGRMDIWKDIINTKVNFLGNNIDYYAVYGVQDSHNTFIQVLADYGTISFVFFTFIIIFIIYKIIRTREFETFIFFSIYFILSLTGNMLFIDNKSTSIYILFFIFLGYLLNQKSIQKQ